MQVNSATRVPGHERPGAPSEFSSPASSFETPAVFAFDGLLASFLNDLAAASPQAQTLRERAEEAETRRRQVAQESQAASAAGGVSPAPADAVIAAEREMTPASQAGRRQHARLEANRAQQREAAARDGQAAQQTPAETARRAAAPARSLTPANATQGETTESVTRSASPPEKSFTDSAAPAPFHPVKAGASAFVAPHLRESASAPALAPFGLPSQGENRGNAAAPLTPPPASFSALTNNNAANAAGAVGARPVVEAGDTVREGKPLSSAGANPALKEVAGVAAKSVAGDGRPLDHAAPVTADSKQVFAGRVWSKQAGRAESAASGDSGANVERITRVVLGRLNKNRSSTILRLDPPLLGSVRLQLDLRDQALQLRIDTQTDVAHRLLSEQMDSLRRNLEAAGIHLERVEVRPPEPVFEQSGANDASQQTDAGRTGREGSAHAEAESSRGRREEMETGFAEPPLNAAREPDWIFAAEPRINVWA